MTVAHYEVAPTGERIASPEASRPGRALVLVAAVVDQLFCAAVVLQAFLGESGYGRFVARFLVAAGAWFVLSLQYRAMRHVALEIRRTIGYVGLGLAALRVVLSGWPEPTLFVWMVEACGVFALGSLACHRALRLRAKELCDAHPKWESCVPAPSVWTGRRIAVVLSSIEWMACGSVETWKGNLWFGQAIAAAGVLGLVLAKDLAAMPDEHRIALKDRPRFRPWVVYPAAAPLLLLRVAWLWMRA